MQILDGNDQRPLCRPGKRDHLQGLKDPALEDVWRQVDRQATARVNGEQVQHIRRGGLQVNPEPLQPMLDLVGDVNTAVIRVNPKGLLQEFNNGQVGHRGTIGAAASFQKRQVFVRERLAELIQQAGFPHASLAHDRDGLAASGFGALIALAQQLELSLPAHKAGEAMLTRHIDATAGVPLTGHPVDPDLVCLALDLHQAQVFTVEIARHQPIGLFGELDSPRRCRLLHAGRQVGGVPYGRVIHAQVVANTAHHHQAGVQPQAELTCHPMRLAELGMVCAQGALERYRGQDGAPGVILMGNGCTKQSHEAIAQELVDGALVAVHPVQRQLKKAIEQGVHGLWPNALGQGSGVGQITEEHRHLLALPCQGAVGGENLIGEVLGGVGERRPFLRPRWCQRRR